MLDNRNVLRTLLWDPLEPVATRPLTVGSTGSLVQPVQWSSEMNDGKLALVYYNYRYYNPADGRWINRDSLKEENFLEIYLKKAVR